METVDVRRLAQFLFEVGTMRKVIRMHRQALLTDDMSDNIATHSFRAALIGIVLAEMEGASVERVALMCLIHDLGEARTNDHNWIHKRYVSEDEPLVLEEQLGSLPFPFLHELAKEYHERKSKEAIVAKDADVLDQVLLLREYAWQGNKEAERWLAGKRDPQPYNYLKFATTESARTLGRALYDEDPSSWWENLYTHKRRD